MVSKQEKMKKEWKSFGIEVEVPQGCSCEYKDCVLSVKGPKGENSKRLKFPKVDISVEGNKVLIKTDRYSKNEKKIILTYRAHVNNLLKGVNEGFEYQLRVVYAKFPITVEVKDGVFTVKNLLGEKVPKKFKIPQGVDIKVNGSDIIVTGIDKEATGQVAGALEQLTKITHLDRRVIQDGIYVIEKPHKRYV